MNFKNGLHCNAWNEYHFLMDNTQVSVEKLKECRLNVWLKIPGSKFENLVEKKKNTKYDLYLSFQSMVYKLNYVACNPSPTLRTIDNHTEWLILHFYIFFFNLSQNDIPNPPNWVYTFDKSTSMVTSLSWYLGTQFNHQGKLVVS